jgi:hypothetical protein
MCKQSFECDFHYCGRGTWVFTVLIISLSQSLVKARGQEVKVYVSSSAGDRLASKAPLRFESKVKTGQAQQVTFRIDENVKYQKMLVLGRRSWKPE